MTKFCMMAKQAGCYPYFIIFDILFIKIFKFISLKNVFII